MFSMSFAATTYTCEPAGDCLNKAPKCQTVTGEEANNGNCGSTCISCCKCITDENETSATTAGGGGVLELPSCIDGGNCSVTDIVQVAVNFTKYLTGIIGAVALLFFIIAGVKMIISQGNPSAVSSAKTMMVQTVIGIVVFLSAYLIVDFVSKALLKNPIELTQTFESQK